jgi:transposase
MTQTQHNQYALQTKVQVVISIITSKRSVSSVARERGIPRKTVCYWLQQYREGVLGKPPVRTGRPPVITPELGDLLHAFITDNPFYSMLDLKSMCEKHGIHVSSHTIWRVLRARDFTYKRCTYVVHNVDKQSTQELLERIHEKQMELQECGIENVVSIDEVPFYEEMVPLYGWAPKGQPLYCKKTRLRSKCHSLIVAITTQGVMASYWVKGNNNKNKFRYFLSHKVLPKCESRHVLLMDNCSIHKTAAIQKYLSKKGVRSIYTVPNTPELNPVENVFSMSKRYVRKHHPVGFSSLQQVVNDSLELAVSSKCENMFKKSFGLTSYQIVR